MTRPSVIVLAIRATVDGTSAILCSSSESATVTQLDASNDVELVTVSVSTATSQGVNRALRLCVCSFKETHPVHPGGTCICALDVHTRADAEDRLIGPTLRVSLGKPQLP